MKLPLSLLSKRARQLILAFTVVEVVVLTLWLDALGIGLGIVPNNQLLAAVILAVGLYLEHLIAGIAGKV
jgi:hypothetical protein